MNTPALWTAKEVRAVTGGHGSSDWSALGISIDSRTVAPGELFVAIEGPNFDGHDFIAAAFENGAAAAVAARIPDGLARKWPLVLVDDTLRALEAMGRARRAEVDARIIAITGSVGKTGTKEALRHALQAAGGQIHANASSLNNHWGVPLSLARMPRDSDYAIFELGMNRPGEIANLANMVRPDLALITTIAPAHLAVFASVADIARAKAEIFQGLTANGLAVIPRDSPYFTLLSDAAEAAGAGKILSFGQASEADVRLERVVEHADCVCVAADIQGTPVTYKVAAPGRHWAINSLAVLAVVHALGADLGRAALALAEFTPLKGRGLRHDVMFRDGQFLLIDESYNANPTSIRAALDVLANSVPGPGGRRIAVLGDMLELGDEAEAMHVELAEELVSRDIDLVFVCGPHMAAMLAALPETRRGGISETSASLKSIVVEAVQPGDVVTVKGSLGMAMAPIVEALLTLDDDGAPVAAAL